MTEEEKTAPKERSPLSPPTFARLVLVLVSVVWMSIGLWAFANPVGLADLVDFHLESSMGRLEIRAMYGGLSIALAVLHFAGVVRKKWRVPALAMAAATLSGLACGRIVSLAVDDFAATGAMLLASELVGLALVGLASWRLVRDKPAS